MDEQVIPPKDRIDIINNRLIDIQAQLETIRFDVGSIKSRCIVEGFGKKAYPTAEVEEHIDDTKKFLASRKPVRLCQCKCGHFEDSYFSSCPLCGEPQDAQE